MLRWLGAIGGRGRLRSHRCAVWGWNSSHVIWVRCRKLWDHLHKSYGEFVVVSERVFEMVIMTINRV